MKKTVLCILLLLTFVQFIFALPNYNNGNGTVLSEKTENGIKITVRKELWYNIKSDTMEGWICIYSGYIASFRDPYFDNRYEILEVIESSGKKWTVRSLNGVVSIYVNLRIRDKPGTSGTNVVYTIRPGTTDPRQTTVDVIAITEEREKIDGKNDYWLKINYKDFTGWIFGGYAASERGGLKYDIPEYMVDFTLGWY